MPFFIDPSTSTFDAKTMNSSWGDHPASRVPLKLKNSTAKDNGMILRFDPVTRKTTVFTHNSGKSNGLAFDLEGNLLSCEGADGGGR